MPPKKAASAAKKDEGKGKAVKRRRQKEESLEVDLEDQDDDVPEKKEKPVRRGRAAKEKQEKQDTSDEEELPQTKKKAAASTSKKQATKDTDSENGATKKAPTRTQAKRGKKTDEAPETEEEPAGAKEPKKAKTGLANATLTKWENLQFNCTSKTSEGKPSNFHITSWNVDGLRAWLKKGGLDILKHDQPDILCLQETKCGLEKLPEEVTEIEGYETLWCSSDKEGYAGVGIITKVKPLSVVYGINSEEHDAEGRCITAEYDKFFLVNVYVPNAGRKLVTLPKRLEWNKLFKEHIKDLDKRKPVIVCGDMNVAHAEIDLANPKTNTKNAGFTPEEREGMTDFLQDGYLDTFRRLYPDKEKVYTFWTYMANARAKNTGWRLDYFIVSEKFMDNVCDNIVHSDVLGSDHCPLSLHINI